MVGVRHMIHVYTQYINVDRRALLDAGQWTDMFVSITVHCYGYLARYEIMVIILIWAANENCAGQGLKARWLTTPFLHKHTPTCL